MSKKVAPEIQDGQEFKLTQSDIIKQVLFMVLKEKLKPAMSPTQWLRFLLAVHAKGWLYVLLKDNKVSLAVAGYAIPDTSDENLRNVPEKEEGDIFYIPFYVPSNLELPKLATKRFFKERKEIRTIVFEGDDDKLVEYEIKSRRKQNGRKKNNRRKTTGHLSRSASGRRQKSSKRTVRRTNKRGLSRSKQQSRVSRANSKL